MSNVWGIADDISGHTGQALGVIAKLGMPYTLKKLEYNALAELPDWMWGGSLLGVDRPHSPPIAPPWPSLLIASGRRALPVLRYIKRRSPKTVTVFIGRPNSMRDIDLAAVPEHDGPLKAPNVVTTLAPLHALTPETLVAARGNWHEQFAHLPRPWVALLLGGNIRNGQYTAADWRELFQQAMALTGDGSLLIATSRRTPQEAITMAEALIHGPHLLHRYRTDKDNPYLGILACAEAFIVTGDSLSMVSEACVTGRPLFLFAAPKVTPEQYRLFHQTLYKRGAARPLSPNERLDWVPTEPLDDAGHVAAEIRARFPQALA